MKQCPKCNRQYDDETLRFCLEDGSPLFTAHDSEAPATEVLPRGQPTLKIAGSTVPSYAPERPIPNQPPAARQSNPIVTVGVVAIALLLLALVGIASFYVIRQASNDSTKNSSDKDSASTPTPKSKSTDSGNDNSTTGSQSDGPLKITASASSVRLAVQSYTYYASNAIDGKRSTAWIEGVDGPGIGEWIRFDFDRAVNLHRIVIQPGYFKSQQIWSENNRLASMTAYFSDGTSRDLNFADRMESQRIDVGSVHTRWVKLVIKSVYYGTDPDTALSEIAFEWD